MNLIPTRPSSGLQRARERIADMAYWRQRGLPGSRPKTRSWSRPLLLLFLFGTSYLLIDRLLKPSMQGRGLEATLTSFLFTCAIFLSYAAGTGALNWRPIRRAGQRVHEYVD